MDAPPPPEPRSLRSLSARADQLLHSLTTMDQDHMPKINRNMTQLSDASKRLHTRLSKKTGRHGVSSLPKQTSETILKQQQLHDLSRGVELLRMALSDVSHYDRQEAAVASAIEDVLLALRAESDVWLFQELDQDWNKFKTDALNLASTLTTTTTSTQPSRGGGGGGTMTSASTLQQLRLHDNEHRLRVAMTPYDLVTQPSSTMAALTGTNDVLLSGGATPKMLAYAAVMSKSSSSTLQVSNFRQVCMDIKDEMHRDVAAMWTLIEHQINATTMKTTTTAKYQGIVHKVTGSASYLELYNLQVARQKTNKTAIKDVIGTGSPWQMAYNYARVGDWKSCSSTLSTHSAASMDPDAQIVAQALVPFFQTTATTNTSTIITSTDALIVAAPQMSDVHKRALVSIACGTSSIPLAATLNQSVDDYLWYKLRGAQALSWLDGMDSFMFAMEDLADRMRSMGPQHFRAEVNPYSYARVMALVGDWETSLGFLTENLSPRHHVADVVHFALCLFKAGLIPATSRGFDVFRTVESYSVSLADFPVAALYILQLANVNENEGDYDVAQVNNALKNLLLRCVSAVSLTSSSPSSSGALRDTLHEMHHYMSSNSTGESFPCNRLKRIVREAAKSPALRPKESMELFLAIASPDGQTFVEGNADLESAFAVLNVELARMLERGSVVGNNAVANQWIEEAKRCRQWLAIENESVAAARHVLPVETRTMLQLSLIVDFYVAESRGELHDLDGYLSWLMPLKDGGSGTTNDDLVVKAKAFSNLSKLVVGIFPRLVVSVADYYGKMFDLARKDNNTAAARLIREKAKMLVTFVGLLRTHAGYALRPDAVQKVAAACEKTSGIF